MKKILIALAFIVTSNVSFAQSCNGTSACEVGSNSQVSNGGSIANGGNVAGGSITGPVSGTSTSSVVTTGTVGNVAGGSVSGTGASTATGNNVTIQDNASTVEAARATADATRYAADRQLRNTPSIATAALTSSNDTCMGSVSVGGAGPGFGISVGSTYKDDNCVMLKNSREMWNMGFKAAAVALMCTDKANKEALELTGYVCPQTAREQQRVTANAAVQSPEYTDPIVRSRMGLPPLK